jgi:hypothetical protein
MKIFQKTKDGYLLPTSLTKRVEKIGTSELILWSENSLFVIGKNLTGWARSQDAFLLEEAHLGAEALLAITAELKKRERNG